MSSRFPKLIAFDLDYTLWPLWVDTHATPPLRLDKNKNVVDRYGTEIAFYPVVPEVFHRIQAADCMIAACSRTSAPNVARQALDLILIPSKKGSDEPPKKAISFFDQMEIYPGSKITHFREIHQKTGIPYSEMLFFDDEYRNMEVQSLGVTMQLVPNGLDVRTFEAGLATWRKRHPEETVADAGGEAA